MSETAITTKEQEALDSCSSDTPSPDEPSTASTTPAAEGEAGAAGESEASQWSIQSLIAMLGFVMVVTILAGFSLLVNFRTSALDPPLYPQFLTYVQPVFPQGWAFFTRSSRETELGIIIVDDEGRLAREQFEPSSRNQFIFGFDRAGRMPGIDMAEILEVLNEDDWVDCDGPLNSDCLQEAWAHPSFEVSVRSAVVHCGTVAVFSREPYPWAYARKGFDWNRVHESVQVGEVVCGA